MHTMHSQAWPRLMLKVFAHEVVGGGREVFVAYGVCPLPVTPGLHHITLRTWSASEPSKHTFRHNMGAIVACRHVQKHPSLNQFYLAFRQLSTHAPSLPGKLPPQASRMPRILTVKPLHTQPAGEPCCHCRSRFTSLPHNHHAALHLGVAPRLDDDLSDMGFVVDPITREEAGQLVHSQGCGLLHLRLQMIMRVRALSECRCVSTM
jgi:hypothetical protein